jgi:sigma-E factor negative regulatory protein RseA
MSETLSALSDGEANDFELRRLLREIEQQAEGEAQPQEGDALASQWRRWHILRSVLKGEVDAEGNSLPTTDISTAVSQDIEAGEVDWQEQIEQAAKQKKVLPWRNMAVAASLSVIAVMGFQQYSAQDEAALLVEQSTGSGVSSQFNSPLNPGSGQLASAKPEPILPQTEKRGSQAVPHAQLLNSSVEPMTNIEDDDVMVEPAQ